MRAAFWLERCRRLLLRGLLSPLDACAVLIELQRGVMHLAFRLSSETELTDRRRRVGRNDSERSSVRS